MNRFNTQLTSPTMIAPQNAAQNPLMWKGNDSLPATQLVSHSSSPFTSRATRPRVRPLHAQPSTLSSGLSVALMMPKIRATTSSVPAFDQPLAAGSVIPDTAQVATPRAAAETSTRSRNLMVQILRELSRGGTHAIAPEEARVGGGVRPAPGAKVRAQRGRVAEAAPVGDRVH